MSTIRVQYGLRIKDLRDERGLSQRGFAARIGMSPTYLADVERGEMGRLVSSGSKQSPERADDLRFLRHSVTRLAAKLKMFRRGHYTSSDSRTMRPS